jgi:hypothetical protein
MKASKTLRRRSKRGNAGVLVGDAAGRDPPKAVKPGRTCKLVDEICVEWQVSIRRACEALEFDRSTYLQISSLRPGGSRTEDQGDLPCSYSRRLVDASTSCFVAKDGAMQNIDADTIANGFRTGLSSELHRNLARSLRCNVASSWG